MTPRPLPEPRLELVERCWRMLSRQKATRILVCGIYRTDVGLEVRAGYEPDDLLYSKYVPEIAAARELGAALRQTVIEKDGFDELPLESPS